MKRSHKILLTAAAGLLAALVPLWMTTSSKAQEPAPPPMMEGRIPFRLELIRSWLEEGYGDRAFRESARLRKDCKDQAEYRSLAETLVAIAFEYRRSPLPKHWDFRLLQKLWREVAASPCATTRLRKCAERQGVALEHEFAVAQHLVSLDTDAAQALRLRKEILDKHPRALLAQQARHGLESLNARYRETTREALRRMAEERDPNWEEILRKIEEGERLLGDLPREWSPIREKASHGLEDRRGFEQALDAADRGDWDRAEEILARIPADSSYREWVGPARRNVGLYRRFGKAQELFLDGQGVRAALLFEQLLEEWPQDLHERDSVESFAREIPRIEDGWKEADRLQKAGEIRAAKDLYRRVLKNPVADGWYRRECDQRMRECEAVLARKLQDLYRGFVQCVEQENWREALTAYRQIAGQDEEDRTLAAARRQIVPQAATLVRLLEKHCASQSISETDRAAAALLETALEPGDPHRAKVEKLKKSYGRQFQRRES